MRLSPSASALGVRLLPGGAQMFETADADAAVAIAVATMSTASAMPRRSHAIVWPDAVPTTLPGSNVRMQSES